MEVNWCQGALDTKGPPTHPPPPPWHTNTAQSAPVWVSPGLWAESGPVTGASLGWIKYKLNCGRHPMPTVSYEQDRNDTSIWPVCFWVKGGSSKWSGWPSAQAQRPEPGMKEVQKRPSQKDPLCSLCSQEQDSNNRVCRWRMTVLESWLELHASVTLHTPLHKPGSFAKLHMG